MKKILQFIGIASVLTIGSVNAQTYLTENFDGPFTGNPAAPAGWTQTRTLLLGDAVVEGTNTNGDKDWEQNSNTGLATWSITPSFGIFPNAAVSGTNVLFINDSYFGSTTNSFGSRRMESPTVNLASSTSPYVRFWYFAGSSSSTMQFRLMASNDGGTTWNSIMLVTPNADVATFASATPWQRINVKVPAAFKVANAKFGLEMSNIWSTQNLFIDDFSVEEFTPTTITSATSGGWSNPATWVGGVVPNANNNVLIAATHTVQTDVNVARMQNVTVDGVFTYSTTSTTQLNQIFGDLTVSATGLYFSGNGTTGKRTYVGGNIVNTGTVNFQPGTSVTGALVWAGYSSAYSGAGTITNNRIPIVVHAAPGGVQYLNPLTISNVCALYLGTVNATNLTLGNAPASVAFLTERYNGTFTNTPTFNNTNISQRNLTFLNPITGQGGITLGLPQATVTPGEEVEIISGARQVTGNLAVNTHNNIVLTYPLSVGTATGTQNITLTRGIISTTTLNLLILNPSATGATGVTPTTFTSNGTNGGIHGSYINGPLQIRFPATGTTARSFPLGQGNAFYTNLPSSNVLRLVTLGGTTAWNSQTITASIEAAPSGPVSGSLVAVFGSRAYRLNYNGGNVLGAGNTVNIRFNNSTFGGSDNLSGNQQDVRIVQSPSLTGTWVEKSNTTGTGAIVPNTLYSITSSSTSAGGALSNDQYFAWATVANVCSGTPANGSITGAISSCGGAASTLTFASSSTSLVGISTQWAASTSSVGPFSNLGIALTQNTGTLASTMFYIVTSSCSISGSVAVSPTFTLQLNPNPTITAVSSSSTYCNPSATPLSFTASGAGTYTWSPIATLSSSVGANVTATPTANIVYNVAGTNTVTGCSSSTNIAIIVNSAPVFSTTVATPSTICSGASSSLQALANSSEYVLSAISYSALPSVGATTLCNNGTASVTLTSGSLDDGGWASIPLPFTFNFTGITTNSVGISTNGFIYMNAGTPPSWTGYSNAFPTTLANNPTFGALYSDLDFDGVGSNSRIEYFTTGTTPNQKFVVNWIGQFFNNTGTVTTQAILYETTNVLEVHTFTSTGTNNGVQGIQNTGATYALTVPGRNSNLFTVTTPDAYRFAPMTITYSWTPSSFLSATNINNPVANAVASSIVYTVSANASNGCSNTSSLGLNVDPSPTVSITGGSVACSGATVNLTANGASTYTWNTGANTTSIAVSPSVNTTYTASGTSTLGCVGSNTFLVNASSNPTVTIAGANSVCIGSSINLTASGASSYNWNTGATTSSIAASPTITTTYTVVGANGPCTTSVTKSVTVNALPTVSAAASSYTACTNGINIGLTGTPLGGTFSGTNVSGTIFTPGASAGTFVPTYAYTNTVTGCSNTASTSIVVSVCTGINSKTANSVAIQVYPNPNTGVFTIELVNGLQKAIQVTDLTGRIVLENTTNEDVFNVNINTLANGVYYVKVISNNTTEVLKVVKQ